MNEDIQTLIDNTLEQSAALVLALHKLSSAMQDMKLTTAPPQEFSMLVEVDTAMIDSASHPKPSKTARDGLAKAPGLPDVQKTSETPPETAQSHQDLSKPTAMTADEVKSAIDELFGIY